MVKKKAKKKKIEHALCWFDHGIFPGTTMFIYNYQHDFVVKYLKKIKATDWLACVENDPMMLRPTQWFCMKRTIEHSKTKEVKTLFVIRVATPFNFDDRAYATLAHEVTHLCQFFLPDILERDREIEAEAYFHTYIMEKCLDAMRYKAKRIKENTY